MSKVPIRPTVVRKVPAKDGKRIKPHGQIMKILAIAVRRFADANAAGAPKHAIDFSNNPFRLVEISALSRFGVERNDDDDPEGISPQILLAVQPDVLRTHPVELVEDMARVLAGPPWSTSEAEWIGIRKALELLGHQRCYRLALVEPDVFVELVWQNRLKIMTFKFCLGPVDHADGAFEPRR